MWQRKKLMLSNRLEQAVKDGKITEAQKQKILDKRDEIQADREAESKQNRSEWISWMKENGIDSDVLMPYFRPGGPQTKGFHHTKGMN